MEKQAQNIQEAFLNNARKDKTFLTIYLMSGVKLSGRIKSFDKYSVILETNNQEQLIFKHAISTVVVSSRSILAPRAFERRHRRARTAGHPARRPVEPSSTRQDACQLSEEIALLVGLRLTGRGTQRVLGRRFRLISAEESLEELAALAATAGAERGRNRSSRGPRRCGHAGRLRQSGRAQGPDPFPRSRPR